MCVCVCVCMCLCVCVCVCTVKLHLEGTSQSRAHYIGLHIFAYTSPYLLAYSLHSKYLRFSDSFNEFSGNSLT